MNPSVYDEVTREAWADYDTQDFTPNNYPGPDDPDDNPGDAARFIPFVEMGDGTQWGINIPDPWQQLEQQPRRACPDCELTTTTGNLRDRHLHTTHLRNQGVVLDQPGRRAA